MGPRVSTIRLERADRYVFDVIHGRPLHQNQPKARRSAPSLPQLRWRTHDRRRERPRVFRAAQHIGRVRPSSTLESRRGPPSFDNETCPEIGRIPFARRLHRPLSNPERVERPVTTEVSIEKSLYQHRSSVLIDYPQANE
jgi:hypothetical protein